MMPTALRLSFILVSLLLFACGGGGGDGAVPGDNKSYAVGGEVSGLNGTVVLQNNAGDDLTLTTDGAFTFATVLADSAEFKVTVAKQPVSQICTVANGSGTLAGADISNIAVTCQDGGQILGSVAGTIIVAMNANGEVVASDDTAGKTRDGNGNYPFSLSGIPTGENIRVFLITGNGVYPLYFDGDGDGTPDTNVFSLSAVTVLDLGFVNTAVAGQDGRAIPQNNPVALAEINAASQNDLVPAKASLIGSWGFGRLKHRNNGSWAARSGRFIYHADGTGTTIWQENDNNSFTSATPSWTWTADTNPDGSITVIRTLADNSIRTRRIVISDDGRVMLLDGTDDPTSQRFRVAIRMDASKTYTDADFDGQFYYLEYAREFNHWSMSADITVDGAGHYDLAATLNSDGSIFPGVTFGGGYGVNTLGVVQFDDVPLENYVNGSDLVGASSATADTWMARFGMHQTDRTYTTADLAGSWAYMSFLDDNNGASYAASFGTMNCNASGNCTAKARFNRDGFISVVSEDPAVTFSVLADGSFGKSFGTSTPANAAAIGNDGNVMLINPSFEDPSVRRIVVAVRCSTCSELASGGGPGLTQLTTDPANDVHPYFSANGSKIVFASNRSGNSDVWVMDADGSNPVQITTDTANDRRPFWSPDGTRIVFHSDRSGNEDLWIINADGSNPTQLTTDPGADSHPVWSPDGSKIAFQSNRSGNSDLWLINPDGTGLTQLTTDTHDDSHPMWSPDGTRIAFARTLSSRDIWVMNADGTGQHAITNDPADEQHADWSPDGTRIAFRSNKAGNYDVWVMDADGTHPQQITTHPADDRNPDWSPDGTQIVFRSDRTGNQEIWRYTFPNVLTVTGTITLPAGVTNQQWFVGIDTDLDGDNGMAAYQQGSVTGNSFNYSINLPSAGDYYVFAEVNVSGGQPGPWETGDYVGEACGNRLIGSECTVNIGTDSRFDFTLIEMP